MDQKVEKQLLANLLNQLVNFMKEIPQVDLHLMVMFGYHQLRMEIVKQMH